jgi:hypothetical protein
VRLVLVPLLLIGVLAAIGLATRDEVAQEDSPAPVVKLVEIGRFDEPLYVTSPPNDDRLFVVEKKGRIWVLRNGRRLPRPFLDLSRQVSAVGLEEGLLALAFAPDYARSGLFYVDYTDLRHRTIVEEFTRSADPNVADRRTARRVLVLSNPTDRHHAGHLLFGPDGYLYIAQGDGGNSSRTNYPAQRLDHLHGKILRIDPRPREGGRYRIPDDNPFVGRAGRDEIWHYGLRNPWRFAIDEKTGAMVIGDAGQLSVEELDVATGRGKNFGWNCFEGSSRFTPGGPESCAAAVPPAIEHFRVATRPGSRDVVEPVVLRGRPPADVRLRPAEHACSVVAGVFVQDPQLPDLLGRHIYGDFCNPSLRSFRVEDGRAVDLQPLGADVLLLSSFGVDSANRVYATSLAGPVYRIEAAE